MNLNPALTGVFRGDQRISVNYRNQWRNVPVDYLQLTGAYDLNLWQDNERPGPFGVGLIFNYDQAGDSKLHLAQLGVAASYTVQVARHHGISFGAMLSGAERGFNLSELTFDEQFLVDKGFDETAPINESFDETSYVFGDAALGVNYHVEASEKRTTIDVGVGAFHLFRPMNNFYNSADHRLPVRLSFSADGAIEFMGPVDLLLRGMFQKQGEYAELVAGAGARIHLNETPTRELAIALGVMTRQNDTGNHFDLTTEPDFSGKWRQDALIPFIGVEWQRWRASFSYDINTSKFRRATNRRGGPELAMAYIITRVPPLEYCPTCPTTL